MRARVCRKQFFGHVLRLDAFQKHSHKLHSHIHAYFLSLLCFFLFHRLAHQIGLFSKFTFALFEHDSEDVVVSLIMAVRA